MSVQDAALAWHDAGACVLPAAPDGTKTPPFKWTPYKTSRPSREQVATWATTYPGIGMICGAVSGGIEMLELEGAAVEAGIHLELRRLIEAAGHADLWDRLQTYVEISPRGGIHWLFRVDGIPVAGNTKLAKRPRTPTPDNPSTVETLIETRGEGGWTVLAPSGGTTHETGRPWQIVAGRPGTVPVLTADEVDTLHRLAATFDEMPDLPAPADPRPAVQRQPGELTPGDDYNQRTDWADILVPAGWTLVGTRGGIRYWRRPGKRIGVSATTGYGDQGHDLLYVFTTSTEFEAPRSYSKLGAYAVLHHGGDFAAAARALRRKGYGSPATQERINPLTLIQGGVASQSVTDGTAALSPQPVDLTTLERSEDGHAQAIIAAYGDVIRFCPERGRWLVWSGTTWRWQAEDGGLVREYAKTIARALPDDDNGAIAHKRKALSAAGTSGALRQARTDPRITVEPGDLDAWAWELNTPDGIIDLTTGELRAADPAHLHTQITSCTPDPTADQTAWHQFLHETFDGDTELIGYLQRLVGYSAVGEVGPHVLPFCVGSGGNGKGVFLEAVTGVLGDYATSAPSGFLMAGQQQHETEIARLAGRRMVLCSEVNDGDRFDEAKVKLLTGGDSLTARFMRADHFTFTPTHQLWLMGNHRPEVRAGGDSFWRRLRQVDFRHTVPEERRIDGLQRILAGQHGPAVLAWIVAGAVAYHRGGLAEPDSVKVATAEYAHDQDTVGRFLEERCHLGGGPQVQTKAGVLRAAYERWCGEAGETPVSAKAFGIALRRTGIEASRTKQCRLYNGVALLSDNDEEER